MKKLILVMLAAVLFNPHSFAQASATGSASAGSAPATGTGATTGTSSGTGAIPTAPSAGTMPSTSGSTGVTPRNANGQPASPNLNGPTTTTQPSDTTTNPGSSTIRPYDSTTNPGSDTINSYGTRPGGLDANSGGVTAQDQSMKTGDTEITRKIRNELMNRDLSTAAKNVTIVTNKGRVTLRGEVPNMTERTTVQNIARSVSHNVKNEITIVK